MAPHARPAGRWSTYFVATVLAAAGLLFSLNASWHAPQKTFVLLLIAVALSAYLGGFGPGFWAALIGVLGSVYFFLPPIHSLRVDGRANVLLVGAFMSLATLVAFVIEQSLSRERSR